MIAEGSAASGAYKFLKVATNLPLSHTPTTTTTTTTNVSLLRPCGRRHEKANARDAEQQQPQQQQQQQRTSSSSSSFASARSEARVRSELTVRSPQNQHHHPPHQPYGHPSPSCPPPPRLWSADLNFSRPTTPSHNGVRTLPLFLSPLSPPPVSFPPAIPLLTVRNSLVLYNQAVAVAAAAGANANPVLLVGGQALRPFVHRPQQIAVLALPGQDVVFVRGTITPGQMGQHRPSYTNAVLIQSRGQLQAPPCGRCRGSPGLTPFPECRRLPGHFGGCCGNCKWRDHAVRCSARDAGPDNNPGPGAGGGAGAQRTILAGGGGEEEGEEEEEEEEEGGEEGGKRGGPAAAGATQETAIVLD
jgi:hypothetical protein